MWSAVPIGVLAGIACNFAVDLKNLLRIDDGLDVYALHGVGGAVGSVLTGIFSADYVAATDGATIIDGGWLNHNWVQVGYQLAAICATILWTCTLTAIILLIQDRIPFLRLRLRPEEEELGTDNVQIGEFTYDENEMYIPEPVRSHTSQKAPAQHNLIDDQINTDGTSTGEAEKKTATAV